MKTPASAYIAQLRSLQQDLSTVMKGWPAGSSFDTAKRYAENIAKLTAGQIQVLQRAPIQLNPSNPVQLRSEIEALRNLMTDAGEKKRFLDYIAMLDSLINDGAK